MVGAKAALGEFIQKLVAISSAERIAVRSAYFAKFKEVRYWWYYNIILFIKNQFCFLDLKLF